MIGSDHNRNAHRADRVGRTVAAGLAHHRAGRLARAEALYRKALERDSEQADALHLLGVITLQQGDAERAIVLIQSALRGLPDLPEAHLNLGNAFHKAGSLTEAVDSYREAIVLDPDLGMAHSNLAGVLNAQDLFDAALESSDRAIRLMPNFPGGHVNRATALLGLERYDEAEATLRRAAELLPDQAEIYCQLGCVLAALGRADEAIATYRQALVLEPDDPEIHSRLGALLQRESLLDEAVASYRREVGLRPSAAEAHLNLGCALLAQNRLDEATASFGRASTLKNDFAEAHNNLGSALLSQGRPDDAVVSYRRAVQSKPDFVEAHINLADALAELGNFGAAQVSYQRALTLQPDHARAHRNLGYFLTDQGRLSEAEASFGRAAACRPADPDILGPWFHAKQRICDWTGYRENKERVRNAIRLQPSLGTTFDLLAVISNPKEQYDCVRGAADGIQVHESALLPLKAPRSKERLRVGYLSADFREHATAMLICGLIERHDRRRFEVIGYSYGADDGSAMRARLGAAFDRFVEIGKMPHRQAAELIHADEVDVLIDLKGFTRNCRPAILACRPAPIQVNYLGYPGTMGADFIDYIIVDSFVAPSDQQPFYAERLVQMPDCYQCNDDKRVIAEQTPSRVECGLPKAGFVFCCFNNSYKLTPKFFDIWMRLLRAVPGSVLWLLGPNPWARANLAREAAARGVQPERLVFAPPLPAAAHLARHRCADLFLDTLPVNAHTTASDALWAGLPLLTCAGDTFVGRVAGSLLRAIGLGELVTTSLAEYEALALRLAQEPEMLAQLRACLAQNRLTHPLFDTGRSTRHLEAAYMQMWETWTAGRPPTALAVPPSAPAW